MPWVYNPFMTDDEFSLIDRWFRQVGAEVAGVVVGIGDDCALLDIARADRLAVTTDTLVAGVHFPQDSEPFDIGYKSLAVSLSDLAAMGAKPAWFTLALTLPTADETWLRSFSSGLFALASNEDVALVGGDTTRGPLSVTVQAMGLQTAGQALLRSGACVGDQIWVTGTLGDAAAGLVLARSAASCVSDDCDYLLGRLRRPQPRVAAGLALLGVATAAIDVSDGLAQDLGHLLDASEVGATIEPAALPLSGALSRRMSLPAGIDLALTGGDDYELCFTVPAQRTRALSRLSLGDRVQATRIGTIDQQPGLRVRNRDGRITPLAAVGYRHF